MTDREGMSHRMSQDERAASAAADAVVVARQGSVQVITINRPAVRNALNQAVAVVSRRRWTSWTRTTTCGPGC